MQPSTRTAAMSPKGTPVTTAANADTTAMIDGGTSQRDGGNMQTSVRMSSIDASPEINDAPPSELQTMSDSVDGGSVPTETARPKDTLPTEPTYRNLVAAIANIREGRSPRKNIPPATSPFILCSPGRVINDSPSTVPLHPRGSPSTAPPPATSPFILRSPARATNCSTRRTIPPATSPFIPSSPARVTNGSASTVPPHARGSPSNEINNEIDTRGRSDNDDLPPVPRRRVPPSIENRNQNPAMFGEQGAVVSYALAEDMALETDHAQHSRPSFASQFAGVPVDEPRQLCDRTGIKRRRIHGAVLDDTRLGNHHDWATTIVENMSLTRFVLSPEIFNRRDMQRLRMLYDKDPVSAREIWSRKRLQRDWFEIPGTLECDRTFARDPLECYYVARMDELLMGGDLEDAINNPPLLQDPLLPRWWSAFRHRCDWYREGWYRHNIGVLLPNDDIEVQQWDPTTLKDEYPCVPSEYRELEITPGLPVPTPLSVWYYHYELLHGDENSPRMAILRRSVLDELIQLTIASWVNECKDGDRQFILTESSIELLRAYVGHRSVVQGEHRSQIFSQMMIARSIHSDLWNEMRFSDEKFPVSFFVDSTRGRVAPNMEEIGGRVIYVSTRSRKMYDDLRQTRRLELRNSATLPLKLYQNDIAQIPGLIEISRDQNWILQRGVTVKSALQSLTEIIKDQAAEISTLRSQVFHMNRATTAEAAGDGSSDGPAF